MVRMQGWWIKCVISGKTQQQEVSSKWRSFELVKWITARNLQWLGHIWECDQRGELKQAVFEMFKMRRASISERAIYWWMRRARSLGANYVCMRWDIKTIGGRESVVTVEVSSAHFKEGETLTFTVITTPVLVGKIFGIACLISRATNRKCQCAVHSISKHSSTVSAQHELRS